MTSPLRMSAVVAKRRPVLEVEFDEVGSAIGEEDRAVSPQPDIILQPDSAPTRKIDARLDRDHRADRQEGFGRGGSAGAASRGPSCTSSPRPWPREWPNASP